MDFKKAKENYIKRFGGFPYFLMMGMEDEEAAKLMEKAVEEGKEIQIESENIY
jgi:hypothetical protein